ncbi:hypothetical protein BC829DRAFT_83153 [Chytridium lagenaria]|nr:hypothetical protein BC829DRAFT_83153 [Chytridium lagenaria]
MMFGERTSRTVRVLASAPTLLLLLSAFVIVVPTDVSAIPAPQNAALHVNRRAVVMDAVAVDAHQKVAQSKKEDDDEETYMDSTDFNTPPKSEPAYNNSHAASASKASSPRRHIVQESPKKDDEEEAYMDVATNAPKGDEDVYVQTAPVYDNSAKSARRHVVKQITKDDDEEAYHDSVDMNIIKVDDDEEAYHDSVELVNRPGTANDDDEEVYHDSVQPAAAPVRMAAHRTAKSTYTNVGTACTQAFKNYMLDAASVMSCYNSISNSGGVNVIVSLANEHATRFSNEYKRIMDSPSQRGKSSSCGNVNSLPEFTSLDLLDCYKPSASPKPPRTAKGKVLVVKPPQRKRRPAAAGVTTAKGEPSVVKPASYNVQDIHTAKDIPMTGTNARGARMSKFSGSGDPAKSGPCLKAFENSMLKADIVMDCYNSLVSHGGMDSFIGLARTHSKQFASNYQTIADSVSTTRTLTSCSNVRSMPMFTSLDLLDCYQPTSITTAKGNVLVNFAPNAKTEAVSNAAAPARARHGIAPAAITTPLNNWAAPAAVATPVYKNWAAPAAIATPQNNWVSPAAVATPVHNNWVAPAAVATPYKNWVAPAAVVTPPKNLAAPAAVATPRNEWGSPDRVVDHHNRVAPAAVATPVPTHNAGQNSVDQSAAPVDDKPRRKYRHESTPAIEMGRRVTPQAVKADAGSSPVCTTAFKDSTLTASTVMDCFKSLNAAENGVAPFVDMIKYHASKYNSQYAIPQNGVPNSPTSAILPHSCSNVASKPTFTSLDLLDCYRPASAAHVAASNAGPVLSGILQKPSAAPSVNVERKDMAMDTCNKAFSKTSMVAEDAVNCYMSLNDRKIFVNTVAKYAGFDSIDKVRPYDAACNKLSGSFTAVDLAACYNQLNNGNTATDVPVDVKNVGNQSGLPVQAPPQIGAQIPPQSGLPVPPQIGAQIPPQSGFPVPPQIGITAPPQQAQVQRPPNAPLYTQSPPCPQLILSGATTLSETALFS